MEEETFGMAARKWEDGKERETRKQEEVGAGEDEGERRGKKKEKEDRFGWGILGGNQEFCG